MTLILMCAAELTPAWCPLFQQTVITPVPKKPNSSENNDYRPVALTSIVMKCFEKYVVSLLRAEIDSKLDPWQFAYKQGRSTDDAFGCITHLVLNKHLEDTKAYARLLFIDFSSAFNTLQPYLLLDKLRQMNVNSFIIKWYFSFLTNRIQHVKVNKAISDPRCISTGAPQGCVSSPVLFTLYTNGCVSKTPNNYIVKFSDDTAILSLLHRDQDTSVYHSEIKQFTDWCKSHHLIVNVGKTEEIIFDPRCIGDHSPVFTESTPINQVTSYKYLGVHIDSSLSWYVHVDNLCAKLQQSLYFLRRLRLYAVNDQILLLFLSDDPRERS